MKPAKAGQLRHRIAIQTIDTTRDAVGGQATSYTTVTTVWGAIRPLNGREVFNAQAADADVTHEITIRHYSGLTPKHRLYHDSRAFNIESIRNIEERDRLMICLCKEVTNG